MATFAKGLLQRYEVANMMNVRTIGGVAAASVLLLAPSIARADTNVTPAATLVYNFTYSANNQISSRDSANPAQAYGAVNSSTGGNDFTNPNSGQGHYEATLTDKGTMTVNIIGKQPDGGLILNISEAGENARRAPAATCVVYGNTRVICDPNKTVFSEEYTLLRFLGLNFVDPSQLDANKHWNATGIGGPGLDVSASYTINSNDKGQMQIGETRKITNTGSTIRVTTDVESKIGYDYNRSVPTSVEEYVQQRNDQGTNGNSLTTYQTTLQLVSDTMAKT
jgi:hypothetical protein